MSGLISIIMPVKNTAPFLKECLDSFINQTYKEWELIAINDASTDSSLEILESYAQQDKRITVIPNNGQGVVAALQTGYAISKGAYVSRMDSDDINDSQKFEIMLQQLRQAGIGHIALGLVSYFAKDGIGDGYKRYEQWMNDLLVKGMGFEEIYKECVIPSPCWLMHKEDFDRMGAFEINCYPEDYDLCFRAYQAGLKCLRAYQVLLHWRDRPERTTRVDENYKAEKMLTLKCYYFLEIDYESKKNLVLWGAGRRGKFIAQYLVEKDIPFIWICNNENKIGKDIYGVVLESEEALAQLDDKQIIVSVANADEQHEINERCNAKEWETYFFC